MYKALGLQNTAVICNMPKFTISYKVWIYQVSQEEVLKSNQPKPHQNRARNTTMNTATGKSAVQTARRNLECRSVDAEPEADAPTHLFPDPDKSEPKIRASQTPSQDKGIPIFIKKSPLHYRSNTSRLLPEGHPAYLSFPRSNVESLEELHGYLCIVPNLYLFPDLCSPLAF